MKKFKFKLEVVLNERKRVEDLRLREWVLAKRILQSMIDELAAMEQRLKKAFREATDTGANDPAMLSTIESFIQGTKIRIVWKKRDIERGAKLTERKRLEYVHASQKRAMLDKLKEKQLEQFREEVKMRELKELDDIYIMNGAARRRMENEDVPA
jgi:flagellar protein FliJ